MRQIITILRVLIFLLITCDLANSQVFNSGIGLPGNKDPEATLHLYGIGEYGAGTRLIFGDDIADGGIEAYIAEYGWNNQPPTDSDMLELHGTLGIKFSIGTNLNPLSVPFEINDDGYVQVNNMNPIAQSDKIVMRENDGTLSEKSLTDLMITYFLNLPNGLQTLLDAGETPLNLLNRGAAILDFYGKRYQGGLIFYLKSDGTGMVSAEEDQSIDAEWGCIGDTLLFFDTLGSGAQNTIDIVTACPTPDIAADICTDLVLNGYDDWFLPSQDELNLMWINLADSDGNGVNMGLSDPDNLGNFPTERYWTSSQYDGVTAFMQWFDDGAQFNAPKSFPTYVRAARKF